MTTKHAFYVKAGSTGDDWSPMRRLDGGSLLVVFTWTLIIVTNYATVKGIFEVYFTSGANSAIISRLPWFNQRYSFVGHVLAVLYQLLSGCVLLCHIRSVLADPGGTDKLAPIEPPAGVLHSRTCKSCGPRWKPPRAHHCRKCQKCVFRMDHHCNWINSCVGIANQKFFILFLIYAAALCVFQFLLLAYAATAAFLWRRVLPGPSIKAVCCGLLLLVEVLFSFQMTLEFLSEQYDALRTNSTLVESHQHTHGVETGFWDQVRVVFGAKSPVWTWPLPSAPHLELDLTEPVFLDKVVADHLRAQQQRGCNNIDNNNNNSPRHIMEQRTYEAAGCTFIPGGETANLRSTTSPKATLVTEKNAGAYLETEFENIYIKPAEDIGVDLDDDETQFINLESIFDAENDSEDDEESYTDSVDRSDDDMIRGDADFNWKQRAPLSEIPRPHKKWPPTLHYNTSVMQQRTHHVATACMK